jgi:carbon-monoxide dehydrogenase medium subunit
VRPFAYARPASLPEAVALLAGAASDARALAGGTDLLIRLRDGSARPTLVVDIKRVAGIGRGIVLEGDRVVIGALTTMTAIAEDPLVRARFAALAEAAAVVGSRQIRNRATLGGNLCNASPAADTAPGLLVLGAWVRAVGPDGERRFPLDELFVRSGVTTLLPGELLTAVELPLPPLPTASVHVRRTRRRGHDLASVTLAVAIDAAGGAWLAYGSVGPRPLVVSDPSGALGDAAASGDRVESALERLLAAASPSLTSMRATPEYRLAMLRVLALRARATALERLAAATAGGVPPASAGGPR